MSLQYLADFESEAIGEDTDEILTTHWIEPGLVLAGTLDGRLFAWHAGHGTPVGSAASASHGIGVCGISSSSTNQTVLTSAMDGTVVLWDSSAVAEYLASLPSPESQDEPGGPRHEDGTLAWPLKVVGKYTFGERSRGGPNTDTDIDVVKDSKVPIATLLHPTQQYFAATGLDATVLLYQFEMSGQEGICTLLDQFRPGGESTDDATTSKSETTGKQRDCGLALAFSVSGDVIAVGTQKGRVHLFEVHKARWLETINVHAVAVRALHFLPGGELLVGSDDGTVTVYDVRAAAVTDESGMAADGESDVEMFDDDDAEDFSQSQPSQYTMSQNSTGSLFSQTQGRRAAERQSAAPFVKSWNTGSPWITDLRASPDGRIVATSSLDGTVRIWDFKSPPPAVALCTIAQDGEVSSLAWKPPPAGGQQQNNQQASRAGSMTAATQSAQTASTFVTGSSDRRVRWYRCAGGGASAM